MLRRRAMKLDAGMHVLPPPAEFDCIVDASLCSQLLRPSGVRYTARRRLARQPYDAIAVEVDRSDCAKTSTTSDVG